jgi:hypothetical protein
LQRSATACATGRESPTRNLSSVPPEPPGAWQTGERYRVVERNELPGGWYRLKYIFLDGSSQYVTFRPATYTDENIELTGLHLADAPDLRNFR